MMSVMDGVSSGQSLPPIFKKHNESSATPVVEIVRPNTSSESALNNEHLSSSQRGEHKMTSLKIK